MIGDAMLAAEGSAAVTFYTFAGEPGFQQRMKLQVGCLSSL
jgi:hypothetical protein